MINRLRNFLLILNLYLTFSGIPAQSQSSQIIGADITYSYVATNQYLVQVRLFRDCASISAPATIDICYHSDTCNLSATSTLVMSPIFIELPHCPYLPPVVTTCQGGTGFGVERYTYEGLVTLPFTCSDWVLSYTAPVLSTGPFSQGFPNFIVTTKIDNLNFPLNFSCTFLSNPIFQFCIGQLDYESFASSDADGDSLVYELVSTFADSFICPPQPVPPSPGSFLFQLLSSTPYYMHPSDGWMNFTPSMIQVGNVSVKVSEYRQGQLINETLASHMVCSIGGCISTGVANGLAADFKISPVPVTNLLTFDIPVAGILQITSATGQLVYAETFTAEATKQSKIDVSKFPSGLYYLTFNGKYGFKSQVFVKN